MRSKYRGVCVALVATLAVTALSGFGVRDHTRIQSRQPRRKIQRERRISLGFSNGWAFEYTGATVSGEFVTSGPHGFRALQNVTMKFTGGDQLISCDNGVKGELVLKGLEGWLGYLDVPTKQIGIAFFKPGGNTFAMKLEKLITPCTAVSYGNADFEGVFLVPLTKAKATVGHTVSPLPRRADI